MTTTNVNPLGGYDPQTATDTDKVNAVLTILNVAGEVRDNFQITADPIQNLIGVSTLCVETLDAIEWALAIPGKHVPKAPDQPTYRPAS